MGSLTKALDIKDLLCLAERKARLKQVIKNTIESMVVVRVRKELVLVPKIDSTSERLSNNPPPRPAWTKIITINKKHTEA
jgi:hypothetical protein